MYFKKVILFSIILVTVLTLFIGCDAVDSFFTSGGTYKINVIAGQIPLDVNSFVSRGTQITPFFEESVAKDPDITSLIIYIDEFQNWQVVYSLDNETEEYEESILIDNLDEKLPSFDLPEDLPIGYYHLVFEIMGGNNILQRTEKGFFYLNDAFFSFKGIDIHFPGISNNLQLIPKGQIIMFEALLEFDVDLDPFIVWYNGRTRISEGFYSEGADILLWKSPEQSSFYPIRAEVFPVFEHEGLSGFINEISVLVSSNVNAQDVHLINEDIPELINWYTFEGNLNDSKTSTPVFSRSIVPINYDIKVDALWVPVNGTYGLASGNGNVFLLPKTSLSNSQDTWQLLFRFMPINDDTILKVNFGTNANVVLYLKLLNNKFVLTIKSPLKEVSETYNLPVKKDSFITMGLSFTSSPNMLSASINIFNNDIFLSELKRPPISIETNIGSEFQIILGSDVIQKIEIPEIVILTESDVFIEDLEEDEQFDEIVIDMPQMQKEIIKRSFSCFTILWDEFALYKNPKIELIESEIISNTIEPTQINE